MRCDQQSHIDAQRVSNVFSLHSHPDISSGPERAALAQHTDAEIADILHERGFRSGQGHRFGSNIVSNIRIKDRLRTRYERLRERGMVSADELASTNGVSRQTVLRWRKHGLVQAHAYNDNDQYLYDPAAAPPPATPAGHAPGKNEWLTASTNDKEVQCEV